jgi:putative phosphoesterase
VTNTQESTQVHSQRFEARRIGFLADTHVKTPGDLSSEAYRAFKGTDLIVHCEHIGNIQLLDRLQQIAPTIAVVVGLDEDQNGEAIAGPYKERVAQLRRVIETPWASIGVQFNLSGQNNAMSSYPPPFPTDKRGTREYLAEQFGRRVDVVVSANTHTGSVHSRDGVLFVDPGSPNLPADWRQGGPGTIAIVDEHEGFIRAEIVDLGRVRPDPSELASTNA